MEGKTKSKGFVYQAGLQWKGQNKFFSTCLVQHLNAV